MRWTQVDPTVYPVAYDEVTKAHLRLTSDDSRDLVNELIAACTEYAENATSSSLITRAVTAVFEQGDALYLPRGPIVSITSVTDDAGTVLTDYDLSHWGNATLLVPETSFVFPLTVVYQAGYGSTGANVPAIFRMAIRAHVATLFETTMSVSDKQLFTVPNSLEAFYRQKSREVPIA